MATFTERSKAQFMVEAAHWRQIASARARGMEMLRGRAEKAEKNARYFEDEWMSVLNMCRSAGFNPYNYENAEGR